MLDLNLITSENVDYAIRVQNEIFPEYNGKNNYLSSIENSKQSQFFLVFDKKKCIGVTGIYSYKNDHDNAWIGFFGIKEEYRNRGYGSKTLKLTEKYAKSMGYKFVRLFTDKLDNDLAIKFYRDNGYTFEDYNNDEEALKDEFNVIIGSKSICDEEVPLWNNKFINLTKQTAKQQYNEVIEMSNDTETDYTIEEVKTQKIDGKVKKRYKLVSKYLSAKDIRYHGPLSYRHLRALAWISLAVSQFILLINIVDSFFSNIQILGIKSNIILSSIGSLSIPFFLVAAFSLILTRRRTFKSIAMFYGIAYIAVAVGIIFVFDRYVGGIIKNISGNYEIAKRFVYRLYSKKADLNVFADLFVLSMFNFFLNYSPTKEWGKKRLALFRSLCVLPLLFALISTIITGLTRADMIELPFEVYPFLTTKAPLVYAIFISMSVWIKNRERIFIKLGVSRKEYNEYLRTNKNSLAFAVHTSLLFLVISLIDLIFVLCMPGLQYFGGGQCVVLFFAIPFILLYSYTRDYKDNTLDIILPFAGICMVLLAYAEAIYRIVMVLFNSVSS